MHFLVKAYLVQIKRRFIIIIIILIISKIYIAGEASREIIWKKTKPNKLFN